MSDINKLNKHLITLNIFLDCIILVYCVYGTFAGKTVQPWVLGMWVFLVLLNNIVKLEDYQ